ncbi:MAG: autotransporter outer membrane beta-barrel domain-containing protein, partial [Planctomycetes bacterium]|nr:autotransporter outer membrane beta-barrel domain-containing protein [Planctomycetota bacterium]
TIATITSYHRFQGQIGGHIAARRNGRHIAEVVSVASDSGLASMRSTTRFPARPARMHCGRELMGRIWGGGYGVWSDQNSRNGVAGHEYKGGGFLLGTDMTFLDSVTVGFAASYTRGKTDVDDLMTKYDSDILNLGLYANYMHASGLFVNFGIGYGHGWNDYDVNLILGGKKSGKFRSQVWSADLELGYEWQVGGGFPLITSVAVNYIHNRANDWTESASGAGLANRYATDSQNLFDIPLTMRFNKVFALGGGRYIAPEVKAAWIATSGNKRPSLTAGYAGVGGGYTQYGINPGKSRWLVGGGVRAKLSERVGVGAEYTFERRGGYWNHNVSASLGVSF